MTGAIPDRKLPTLGAFGALIYQHMQRLGRSNCALGNELGVDSSTISRWISGQRNALPKHVRAMADAFGLKGAARFVFCAAGGAWPFEDALDSRTASRLSAVLESERRRTMRLQEWAEVAGD